MLVAAVVLSRCHHSGELEAVRASQVQRLLGVCPQHDVLWEDLSCEEHLKLFAGFKGVPAAEVPAFPQRV